MKKFFEKSNLGIRKLLSEQITNTSRTDTLHIRDITKTYNLQIPFGNPSANSQNGKIDKLNLHLHFKIPYFEL